MKINGWYYLVRFYFSFYLEGGVSLYRLPSLLDGVYRPPRLGVDPGKAVPGTVPDPQVGRPLLPVDHRAGAVLAGLN